MHERAAQPRYPGIYFRCCIVGIAAGTSVELLLKAPTKEFVIDERRSSCGILGSYASNYPGFPAEFLTVVAQRKLQPLTRSGSFTPATYPRRCFPPGAFA